MAISTDAIRRITIQSTAQGVSESTAALNQLSAAQDKVAATGSNMAVVTDIATKRQLSAADAYKRQTLSVDDNARSLDRIAKATKVADDALRQGIITQADH